MKKCDYHSMLQISIPQNAKNGQGNLSPGQGKSQGTFFQILGGNPDTDIWQLHTYRQTKIRERIFYLYNLLVSTK